MIDKEEIKAIFAFTKRESRGIFILVLLIFILIIIRYWLPSVISSEIKPELKISHKEFHKLPASETKKDNIDKGSVSSKLFEFDPNTANSAELKSLGFSKFAASNLIKYREKGGVFFRKSDLLKIYGVDSSFLYKIAPYVIIDIKEDNTVKPFRNTTAKTKIVIELNSSGVQRLKSIKGIGDVLSKRIVRYRELLGGFYDVNQIKEVYGISDSLFLTISPELEVDTLGIHKLNINKLNEEELALHPYISNYEARSIIKFREYIGKIQSLNELKVNYLLSEDKFRKLRPYLTL
jgi:competence protein ComEA